MRAQYDGIFIDYPSLPQKDAAGHRTKEDTKIFATGLGAMGNLYASSKCSTVLQIKTIPSPPQDYEGQYGQRPYDRSGWCCFEEGVAQQVLGTEAVIKHWLALLAEPLLLFAVYVKPLLVMLLSAAGGESGARLSSSEELAASSTIERVNTLSRPKLIDIGEPGGTREVKL